MDSAEAHGEAVDMESMTNSMGPLTSASPPPSLLVVPKGIQAITTDRASFSGRYAARRRFTLGQRAPRIRYGIGYGVEDNAPYCSSSISQCLHSGALDYDEQPVTTESHIQRLSATLPALLDHQHVAEASIYKRDNQNLPNFSVIERFGRALPVYEEPLARPQPPPFQGYDDLGEQTLLLLWRNIDAIRLPRHIASSAQVCCLASYEEQDFQEHHSKFHSIDRRRAHEAWYHRAFIALKEFDRRVINYTQRLADTSSNCSASDEARKGKGRGRPRNTAYWDTLKLQNGVNLASTSYVGAGPRREVTELLNRLSFNGPTTETCAAGDVDMEDSPYHERRRDGNARRGGRHSYGGGGGRKRGREDDDDHRDHRRQQRPRYEEPVASRIRRDIIYIGEESPNGVQDQCAGFGRDIANNFDDDQVRGPLLDTLVDMLCEQPLKIPFLAAVALYANNLNANVGHEFITRASKKMAGALELGNWRDFKLLLRFHACLQGVLEDVGIFQILNQLFDWVIDLQSASADDALGLELTKIILLTIPYAVAAYPDATAHLGDILDKTEIVASEAANHPLATFVDAYPANSDDKPFGYQSVVEMLQKQLREEAVRNWAFKCIPRVYVPAKPGTAEDENGVENGASKHALPTLTLPVPVDVTKRPLFPETFFSMFASQDIQTIPNMDNIALSLIRDTMVDTISILHYNRLAVANFLTKVDDFWAPGTFATRGITLDQLRNYPVDRSTWKPEDMFIDAVFSQLLALPDAKQKLIYYHSIIFEACKLAPSAVAPTLGRGIRWLFRHIDDMDLELLYRYLDWFAHHLSNFEFRWKWTEWIDELERSDLTPKKAFIIAAVDKEVRLSFAKRIRDTLPEAYYSLLTEGKFKDIPPFKYDREDTPFSSEGKEIYALMKRKAPEEQIEPYIEAIREQAANHELDPILASTDVYVTAMCHNGAKSVSHITAAIDRSKDRLQKARQESAGVGSQIVQSVVAYWKDQPGNAVNIVDKLLNYTIVTPDSVIEWALGPENLGNGAVLSQSWRYEIVAKTMGKVTGRVQQIVQAKVNLEVQAANADGTDVEAMQPQIGQMNDLLTSERQAMRQLFSTIEDAVAGVATGAADGFVDSATSDDDAELIKAWGVKWARVFRRKLAVEEARVGETAVDAQLVSAKEQDRLAKERAAREAEEEAAARAREEEERAARLAKAEEAKAAENGDTTMRELDMNGAGDAEDLDVAE